MNNNKWALEKEILKNYKFAKIGIEKSINFLYEINYYINSKKYQ